MAKKIMVVDDDTEVAESIAEFFQSIGYEARYAFDGDEAMKLVAEDKPDCILLDIQLPGSRNGLDVLDEVKEIDPNIKVIMITGFVESEVEEECKRSGVDKYIVKPLDFGDLDDMVKELLGEKK